jgi:hypothetical protein
MSRLLLVAAAALLLVAVPASSADEQPPWTRAVYVVDDSDSITEAELADALPAFQAAVSHDLKPYWNVDARLVLGPPPSARAWTITLSDHVDCLFCAGYHDTRLGVPYAKVFTLEDVDWQVVFTHELFEMLVDPQINRAALDKLTFRLVEVADPVEAEQYAYERPSATGQPVQISDFVTERWYRHGLQRGPFDYAGHVRKPLQLLTDGYVSYWTGSNWTQQLASGQRTRRRLAVYPTQP